jgi:acetylornithine deacetylase/succinyl-diaminopimelate desuccinylase family protein
MLDTFRRIIQNRRQEMAEFTAELIAVATENPPGRSCLPALQVIGRRLVALDVDHRIVPVPGGDADPANPRHWLRADWGGAGPTVCFHGHIDVVPAQDPAQFTPVVTEDTIFGRGSADMKGGLVAMIYAIRALKESGVRLRGRIGLRVVPDEETGGALGSRALAAAGLLFDTDAVAMLTAEPTGGAVWHAARGAITCRITVRGRPAHVGLQYRGINAFEQALRVADALGQLKREVERRKTQYPIVPDAARNSILMLGGEVTGGANFNLVPAKFTFTVDRRINPEEDFDAEKLRLLRVIEGVRDQGVDLEVEIIQEARPAGVSPDHPAARVLAESIKDASGEEARFELCPGILETRFYAVAGIPALACGPGLLTVSHGPKEFIKRKDLEACAVIYALTAARVLG